MQAERALLERTNGEVTEVVGIHCAYNVVCNEEALVGVEDIAECWPDCYLATRHSLIQDSIPSARVGAYLQRLTIGSRFVETVEAFGIHQDRTQLTRLFLVVSRVLTGTAEALKGIEPREIRQSIGGGAAAVRRGSARGLRADLTHGYRKLRLHYWKDGEQIALSNVVEDNDSTIY